MFKEKAVNLINLDGSSISINEEGIKILEDIEDDIIVVCIAGKARTGKSYLMNLLLNSIGEDKGVYINITLFSIDNSLKLAHQFNLVLKVFGSGTHPYLVPNQILSLYLLTQKALIQ